MSRTGQRALFMPLNQVHESLGVPPSVVLSASRMGWIETKLAPYRGVPRRQSRRLVNVASVRAFISSLSADERLAYAIHS